MINLLLNLAFILVDPTPVLYPDNPIVTGYISSYNPGVMAVSLDYYDTLNYRSWCGWECRANADLDGYAVVAHCNRIGSIATLTTDGKTYRVLIADCIAQQHIVKGNLFDPDRGYILELDWGLFQAVDVRYGTLTY